MARKNVTDITKEIEKNRRIQGQIEEEYGDPNQWSSKNTYRKHFQGMSDEEVKVLKEEALEEFHSRNKPNILDIAPAVQDKTRVGGLMEDVEVPGGEFADMDIIKEQMINMGFPSGLINDFFETAKKDPKSYQKDLEKMQKILGENPEIQQRMNEALGQPEQEDYPEDFGGDMGPF